MSEHFSADVMNKIKDLIATPGLTTGVPADIAYYIVENVVPGGARITDESWGEPDHWLYRGPVPSGDDDAARYTWLIARGKAAPVEYERDLNEMVGPKWTVEVIEASRNLNLKPKAEDQQEVITREQPETKPPVDITFTPTDDEGSEIRDQTYGQVNDAVFAALPGTLAIRNAEWENSSAWVVLEEVKIKEEKMLVLTVNYSNGIKMPWTPTVMDLMSKSWVSKSPLE